MNPIGYLGLFQAEWRVIVEVLDAGQGAPIDYGLLQQIALRFTSKKNASGDVITKLIEFGILEQPLSGETVYQLSGLAESVVRQLRRDHRLGLSESIQGYIRRLEGATLNLLNSAHAYDLPAVMEQCRKVYEGVRDIKRDTQNNLQAVRNIVTDAKKQDAVKSLKQRYAEVMAAWDDYVQPLGEMIDVHGAFAEAVSLSVERLRSAEAFLEARGALMTDVDNIRRAGLMVLDMSDHVLEGFRSARDALKPLYERARLNSRVTRGVAVYLEYLQKDRLDELGDRVDLPIYRKPGVAVVSDNAALQKYWSMVRDIKHSAPPTIRASREPSAAQKTPPFDVRSAVARLKKSLPVENAFEWVVEMFPGIETEHVLDVIQNAIADRAIAVCRQEETVTLTQRHVITARRLNLEKKHVKRA